MFASLLSTGLTDVPNMHSNSSIVIPATSPNTYLGGIAALNLPSPEGTGDWHFMQTFFVVRSRRSIGFICGDGCEVDTNALLGSTGVFECSKLLKSLGVTFQGTTAYAATHRRAVADLVIFSISTGKSFDHTYIDGWLPRPSDKIGLKKMLNLAASGLNGEHRGKLNTWTHCLKLNPLS